MANGPCDKCVIWCCICIWYGTVETRHISMASHHHLWAFPSHPPPSAIIIMAPSAAAAIIIIIDITKIKSLGAYILKMPLNQSNIIGLPCKKSKYFNWGILEKIFLRFAMGLFSPGHAFSGGALWQSNSLPECEECSLARKAKKIPFYLNVKIQKI